MFLHSCPNVNSGADYENIASNALNTYTLGEHVGRQWGIGRVFKWRSMMDPQTVAKGDNVGHVGLHKVTGTTVEAIVGGVYHQFVRLSPSFTPLPSCIEPFSLRFVGSHTSAQVLPYTSSSSHPIKRDSSRRSRRVPLTGYATLQERKRRSRPLIITPTHNKVIMYVLFPRSFACILGVLWCRLSKG